MFKLVSWELGKTNIKSTITVYAEKKKATEKSLPLESMCHENCLQICAIYSRTEQGMTFGLKGECFALGLKLNFLT